jgi:hypothetical protein
MSNRMTPFHRPAIFGQAAASDRFEAAAAADRASGEGRFTRGSGPHSSPLATGLGAESIPRFALAFAFGWDQVSA